MADPQPDTKVDLQAFIDAPDYSENINVNPDTDVVIPMDDFYKSPIEKLTPDQIKEIDIAGYADDNKPILDIQNVDNLIRWKTQLLFDRADERAEFLKKELPGYEFALDPQNKLNVLLRKKGTRYWGKVDPGYSNDVLTSEFAENIDSIAQALAIPTSALAGALTAGGIEGVRQLAKTYVTTDGDMLNPDKGQSPSLLNVGINAGVGAASGAVAGMLGKTADTAVDAVKAGVTSDTAKAGVGRIQKALNVLENPEHVAQNIGATAKNFAQGVEENISYLFSHFPKAKEAIMAPFTLKGKKKAVDKILTETGEALDGFYSDPKNVMKVGDIFEGKNAQLLDQTIQTSKVVRGLKTLVTDEATTRKASLIQRDLLTRIGKTVLDEDDVYLKAFMKNKLLQMPTVKEYGFKTQNEAMQAILANKELTVAEARMIKDGIASKLKFGKEAGQIKDLDTVYKYALDSLTDTIQGVADKAGDTALAQNNRLFHELAPIAEILDSSVNAAKAQPFNFTKFVPGALNGIRRQALMIATRLAARPEVRAGLSRVTEGGFPFPKTSFGRPGAMDVLKKAARGGSFLEGKELGKKQFLPRDSEAYFSDPQLLNEIASQIDDPELTDALAKQLERGDKEGFSNTLSLAAARDEDLFETAPVKSLVVRDGKPVVMDKYDREYLRQHLKKLPLQQRYDAMQALNMNNEMTVNPFEPPQIKSIKLPSNPKGNTPVARVAARLKQADIIDIGEDTERLDYDY